MKKLSVILFIFILVACSENPTGSMNPTDPEVPVDPDIPTKPTGPVDLWVGAIYNQGWEKEFIGMATGEAFPFESNGDFVMDFHPDKFSLNSFPTQSDTNFTLYDVLDDATGAYYRITYEFGNENIVLYVLIDYVNSSGQTRIYLALPDGSGGAPASDTPVEDRKTWLKEKYVKGYSKFLGDLIAIQVK